MAKSGLLASDRPMAKPARDSHKQEAVAVAPSNRPIAVNHPATEESHKSRNRKRATTRSPPPPPPQRVRCVFIPHDIICNILSRLPARTIIRYRSVCKSWRALLCPSTWGPCKGKPPLPSLGYLIGSLSLLGGSRIRLFFYTQGSAVAPVLFEKDLPGESFPDQPAVAHCNGLLLIRTGNQFHVCNPGTGEFTTLPASTNGCILSATPAGWAFGFDPSTQDYIVVRCFYRSISFDLQTWSVGCEVFTFGTRTWRTIAEDSPYPIAGYPVYLNGVIYWMIGDNHGSPQQFVLALNVKDQVFELIPAPSPYQYTAFLKEMEGNLYLFDIDVRYEHVVVWVLNKDFNNHTWTQDCRINLPVGLYKTMRPVTIHHGTMLFVDGQRLGYFKTRNIQNFGHKERLEAIVDFGDLLLFHPGQTLMFSSKANVRLTPVRYVESLVSFGNLSSRLLPMCFWDHYCC